MNNPKISVIMPVYNSGKYLSTAVESIINQSFADFELILVDDGSTDGSSEKCDEYAQLDKRVVVIHQKNGGICNARNTALKIARGRYIGFSDHDDEFLPGAFEALYNRAIETGADLVKFRKIEIISRDGKFIRSKTNVYPEIVMDREDIRRYFFSLKNNNVLDCIWDTLFKRELLEKHSLDEFFKKGGEDLALMYDVIVDVNRLALINKIYYNHYIRRGFSTSTKYNTQIVDTKRNLINRMNNTLKKLDINRDDYSFDYSFYLLKSVYFPIVNYLADNRSTYSFKEKINILENLMKEEHTPSYFLKQPISKVWKASTKYGFGYLLLKNHWYYLLFLMFNIRGKNS